MDLEEIKEILDKYGYKPHYARISDKDKRMITFLSVSYYLIPIIVTIIKLSSKERIVVKVQLDKIEIDDVKELQPTLNGLYKMHKKKELKL